MATAATQFCETDPMSPITISAVFLLANKCSKHPKPGYFVTVLGQPVQNLEDLSTVYFVYSCDGCYQYAGIADLKETVNARFGEMDRHIVGQGSS